MKDSVKILKNTPIWQFIVFSFNENDIEACRDMATDIGVKFIVINSSRWMGPNDPLRPTNKNLSLNRTQGKEKITGGMHETIYMNDKELNDKKRK
jgi:hypothetical protein